jgi:hypothetical protein
MHIQLSRGFETGYSISHPLGVEYVVTSVQSETVKLHWFSFIVVRSTVALTECLGGCGLFVRKGFRARSGDRKKTPFALR